MLAAAVWQLWLLALEHGFLDERFPLIVAVPVVPKHRQSDHRSQVVADQRCLTRLVDALGGVPAALLALQPSDEQRRLQPLAESPRTLLYVPLALPLV